MPSRSVLPVLLLFFLFDTGIPQACRSPPSSRFSKPFRFSVAIFHMFLCIFEQSSPNEPLIHAQKAPVPGPSGYTNIVYCDGKMFKDTPALRKALYILKAAGIYHNVR